MQTMTSNMQRNGSDTYTPPYNSNNAVNVSANERVLSLIGGLFIFSSGVNNLTSKPFSALGRLAVGTFLLYRGASGNCPVRSYMGREQMQEGSTIEMYTTLTVNKPRHEVYSFWRKLENLPLFMKHLRQVRELDSKTSKWEASLPAKGIPVSWNAEIVEDETNSLIGWCSLPGSMVENAGKVEFRDSINGQGTDIKVLITYRPPAGALGSGIATVLNPIFEKMVREDILNFKQYIEAGEISSLQSQTSGNL